VSEQYIDSIMQDVTIKTVPPS